MSAGEIVAKILRARGIDEAEFEDFLNPSIDGLARPEELPGVEAAADAVLAAMAAGLVQFAVLFPLEKYVLFRKK